MTAEVAVMNCSAIGSAVDSAMSVGDTERAGAAPVSPAAPHSVGGAYIARFGFSSSLRHYDGDTRAAPSFALRTISRTSASIIRAS